MGDTARSPAEIISLPQGGGALRGIGEKFTPDPATGTGSFTVPITVPAGRGGLAPQLALTYSTGAGNGHFGLGWSLPLPGISRRTSHGVPRYDESDVFVLSGYEDLVPLPAEQGAPVLYRPRTEGLFAEIVHHRGPRGGHWQVRTRDGMVSRYGTPPPADAGDWRDPAVCADADDPGRVFAWQLTETRDPMGNVIRYEYGLDAGEEAGHRWRQPVLRTIRYADHTADDGQLRFLARVDLSYEPRPDPFSSYRSGFEIRTSVRCRAVTTTVDDGVERPVRTYEFQYTESAHSNVSLLTSVTAVGFDDDGAAHRDLPPVAFGYTAFEPERRRFTAVTGDDPPPVPLSRGDIELADLTGDGLPDVLQMDGTARYWRNLGGGRFDRPRTLREVPAGTRLADAGVQLLDADGDARVDLLVTTATFAGTVPLRTGADWAAIRPYVKAPTFSLEDPEVRLLDLDGDGVTDAVRAGGPRLQCYFQRTDFGWTESRPARCIDPAGLPRVSLADPRVRWGDMTGDGCQDLVLVHGSSVEYWPNLGHGRWGRRVAMKNGPRLPVHHDPGRLLLADVDGDGLADLVYVGADEVTVWINRCGNGWSPPVTVRGCPPYAAAGSVRIVDLHGTGTGGVLWSSDSGASMYFLDLTGGVKPRLLEEMDNNIGLRTRVRYEPSTRHRLRDEARPRTRWRTPMPFVVPVVAAVESLDLISGTKLTSEYRYHHGYWDGEEREFRGFGRVDQFDTEGGDAFEGLGPEQFSPPTETRTWFHLGPVDPSGDGQWAPLDCRDEYWSGDPPLLQSSLPARAADRRVSRAALRSLRGRVLRSELYARDASKRRDRPYTVTEFAYTVRPEAAPGETATPVFFPFEVARRATQWERGEDPMTHFTFTGGHDAWGQPRLRTVVAPPRRSACRRPVTAAPAHSFVPDETAVLATHTDTAFARPPLGVHLRDRVAQVHTYELLDPPEVEDSSDEIAVVLAGQKRAAEAVRDAFTALDPTVVRLTGHLVHHYDGPAYQGLPAGELGSHGMLTRSESLVFTDSCLDEALGERRPTWLGGTAAPPEGTPAGFAADLGYRRMKKGNGYEDGWYADERSQAHDIQLSTAADPLPGRGLVLATRDALGHETRITPDPYWLLPALVRDPAGLTTTAVYDYRVGRPRQVTDPNGTTTHYRHHPLGLLERTFIVGRNGEGGSAQRPEARYEYDFTAFTASRRPVCVRTLQRVWHAHDGLPSDVTTGRDHDEVIETREYSDGFGRLLQKRVQADESAFEADDCGLPAQPGTAGPALGSRSPARVVVSGWEIRDNKGRVVRKYEPFHDTGWNFQPNAQHGRYLALTYDPRGRLIRVLAPDGSQRRTVFGTPDVVSAPDSAAPSPWTMTVYDENDLAPASTGPDRAPLTDRAPVTHHWTPATTVVDALDRTRARYLRGGADPGKDGHATCTTYDIRGNTLTLTDELGRTAFRYAYDLRNRPLMAGGIDGGARWTIADAAGNPVHSEDARGCMTLRTYDALNRLLTVHARDSADVPLTLRERLVYGDLSSEHDSAAAYRLGRLWRHHDEAGLSTAERYDFTGALTEQTRQVISDTALAAAEPGGWTADWSAPDAAAALDTTEYRTSTRHDALGRAVVITAPSDVTGHRARILPAYGRSGALTSVSVDGTAHLRLLVHNARGQRILVANGAGLVTRYAYDPDTYRLTRLRTEPMTRAPDERWTATGPPLQDLTYSYDLTGNLTRIDERTTGCGVAGTPDGRDRLVRDFTYDAFNRLTEATGRACAELGTLRPLGDTPRCGSYPAAPNQTNAPDVTTGYRESFSYDETGGLLDLCYQVTTGTTRSRWHRIFTVGATTNQLTSVSNASETPLPFSYDANGNVRTEGSSRHYTWDHKGLLTGFRTTAGAGTSVAARYLHGADGSRVKKWVRRGDNAAADESTVYLGGLAEHHTWAKQGGGANSLLHIHDGATRIALVRTGPAHPDDAAPAVRYELTDHLANASLTVDSTASWVNREEYFPYGESSFGSFARKRFRQMAVERDAETGLLHCAARHYAPHLARFTSCDPLGPAAGTHVYAFARGSPLLRTDPSGLLDQDAAVPQAPPPELNGADGGRFEAVREGGGVIWRPGSSEAPDGGASEPSTPLSPSGKTELGSWKRKVEASSESTFGVKRTGPASQPRTSARDDEASVALWSWTALETEVTLAKEESGSYDSWTRTGLWTKTKTGSFSGSLFSFGVSTSGPKLSVASLGATAYSWEAGAMSGNWMGGAVGELSVSAIEVKAELGVKEGKVEAKFGVTLLSARPSAGFNVLGLNLSFFVEGRLGAEIGVSAGVETAVHVGVISLGMTVGEAKGNDPNAGWGHFFSEVMTYGIAPLLPTANPYQRGTSVLRSFAP